MKNLIIIISLVFAATFMQLEAITIYNTRYNNFESINHSRAAVVNGDFLQLHNSTTSNVVVTDSTAIDAFTSYKYYIKFANLHNKEGKTYKITNPQGHSRSISSTECGIVFNHTPRGCWRVAVSCSNSNLYNESVDSRTMTVKLINDYSGGAVVMQTTLDTGVDLDDGYNYLGVTIEDSTISVKMGKSKLKEIMSYHLTSGDLQAMTGVESYRVGNFAGPGAMVSIERAVLAHNEQAQPSPARLETHWTREALDRHFAVSKNPYEGYWTYLDRDMEDQWLRLGGRYTIALVETEQGYDVIYVEGAQVKKSLWHTGMKKGEMTRTIFTDNFTGKWTDATLEPITDDVFVTFESGVILNFKFPVYKSQVRFSKVLNE